MNTTSRIEGLNKQLGTTILCSAEVLDGLVGVRCRPLGRFLLLGKTQPLRICELPGVGEDGSDTVDQWIERWCDSLDLFTDGRWEAALKGFMQFQAMHPDDGPVTFYINTTRAYLRQPPESDEPDVIRLTHK